MHTSNSTYFILRGIYCLRLLVVVSLCHVIGIVLCMYVCQLSLLIWVSYLPEAICCCLQTSTVRDVLLMMNCMCLPVFFVTSADKSNIILSEAICCCLETFSLCGVVDVVLHNCAKMFMVTCANIS